MNDRELVERAKADSDSGLELYDAETGRTYPSCSVILLDSKEQMDRLLALAAKGAEVAGAQERLESRYICAECGPGVAADEDGCCAFCGRDATVKQRRVLILPAKETP